MSTFYVAVVIVNKFYIIANAYQLWRHVYIAWLIMTLADLALAHVILMGVDRPKLEIKMNKRRDVFWSTTVFFL